MKRKPTPLTNLRDVAGPIQPRARFYPDKDVDAATARRDAITLDAALASDLLRVLDGQPGRKR